MDPMLLATFVDAVWLAVTGAIAMAALWLDSRNG